MTAAKSDPKPAAKPAAKTRAAKPDTRNVHERMAAVFAAMPAIAKDAKNVQSKYAARSIDDVMEVCHRLMADEGLFLIPNHRHAPEVTRTTTNEGKVVTDSLVLIDYTFYAPDGTNITMSVSSEGRDWADKATNKAASNALKYGLLHAFLIPVNEFDADTETIEVTKRTERVQTAATQTAEHPDMRAKNAVLAYTNGVKSAASASWVRILTGLGLDPETIIDSESDADRIIEAVNDLIAGVEPDDDAIDAGMGYG